MRRHLKVTAGFTIVELLIVVVVIAILATITIASYNGISARAKVTVVQADLRNLQQAVQLYQADNGSLPYVDSGNVATSALPALETVLKTANLYTSTRRIDANDTSFPKSFLFCSNAARDRLVTIAVKPHAPEGVVPSAGMVFWYADTEGVKSATIGQAEPSTGATYCKSVSADLTFARWSYSVPTAYAQ